MDELSILECLRLEMISARAEATEMEKRIKELEALKDEASDAWAQAWHRYKTLRDRYLKESER